MADSSTMAALPSDMDASPTDLSPIDGSTSNKRIHSQVRHDSRLIATAQQTILTDETDLLFATDVPRLDADGLDVREHFRRRNQA